MTVIGTRQGVAVRGFPRLFIDPRSALGRRALRQSYAVLLAVGTLVMSLIVLLAKLT